MLHGTSCNEDACMIQLINWMKKMENENKAYNMKDFHGGDENNLSSNLKDMGLFALKRNKYKCVY